MSNEIKMCNNCAWSSHAKDSDWQMYCVNVHVNKNNPYALSQQVFRGTDCSSARTGGWFAACGLKGKQWMMKNTTKDTK